MTIQRINLGTYANDGTGDDLLTAFTKVNANFAALSIGTGVLGGTNLGPTTGNVAGIFADKNGTNLEFKSLTSTDNSVTITHSDTTVNLRASPSVVNDLHPALGGNLDLNGHNIVDGAGGADVQTTVYGIDVKTIVGLLQLMIASNKFNIDMTVPGSDFVPTGTVNPSTDTRGYTLDAGFNSPTFIDTLRNSPLDFGTFV